QHEIPDRIESHNQYITAARLPPRSTPRRDPIEAHYANQEEPTTDTQRSRDTRRRDWHHASNHCCPAAGTRPRNSAKSCIARDRSEKRATSRQRRAARSIILQWVG